MSFDNRRRKWIAVWLVVVVFALSIIITLAVLWTMFAPTSSGDSMNAKSQSAQLITPSVLEGRAISKPAPDYPWLAEVLEISGDVQVQVLIDESGAVTAAKALSGPRLLKRVAVEAAGEARFTPTLLSGQPVKVTGVITYRFRLE